MSLTMTSTTVKQQPMNIINTSTSTASTSDSISFLNENNTLNGIYSEPKKTGREVTRDNQLRPLHCHAMEYAWGRLGSSSMVARMKDAQAVQEEDTQFGIDETAPYAELWLGTHPSGMSEVTVHSKLQHGYKANSEFSEENGEHQHHRKTLLDYVQANPELHCGSPNDTDLSFLLKILSVRKVLSIQAHPDKKLAEKLFVQFPDIYKDPNHKPEMAIAISDRVRAMCGFRPIAEIKQHLIDYPEFRSLIGEETAQHVMQFDEQTLGEERDCESQAVLRHVFRAYIQAEPHVIQEHVEEMVTRLRALDGHHDEIQNLILQLEEQFPADCGIFSPLIFNILNMKKGEALYIGANEPHAYVSGEMIECMACSDNVVRAGLTPKLKDIPTLVSMLAYQAGVPETTFGVQVDDCMTRYIPPVPDFLVELIHVPANTVYELSSVASPAVILTMEGEATLKQCQQSTHAELDVSFGSAAFFSAHTTCHIHAGPFGVRLTRACKNVFYGN